mmetsp:Transcript_7580/g.14785  ORF Transcript_7580/g.14785 Transcript_7580/m.14785 type:complete len:112 (-) Transcript_7580:2465-2800(-)
MSVHDTKRFTCTHEKHHAQGMQTKETETWIPVIDESCVSDDRKPTCMGTGHPANPSDPTPFFPMEVRVPTRSTETKKIVRPLSVDTIKMKIKPIVRLLWTAANTNTQGDDP